MKRKHLLIIMAIAFGSVALSGCYCERWHHHYYHHY